MNRDENFGISVIVPAYNEEKTICRVLCDLILISEKVPLEIIVIDDGSTDDTASIIEEHNTRFNFKFLKNESNQGKGNCIVKCLDYVTYSHTLFFDADMEYFAENIPNLFEVVQKNISEVVFGARVHGHYSLQPSFIFALGRRILTNFVNLIYGSFIYDLHTCLKLIPTKLLKDMKLIENGFGLDTEITCKLLKLGIRPFEIPVMYVGRLNSAGKKLRMKDGITCVKIATKIKLRKFLL